MWEFLEKRCLSINKAEFLIMINYQQLCFAIEKLSALGAKTDLKTKNGKAVCLAKIPQNKGFAGFFVLWDVLFGIVRTCRKRQEVACNNGSQTDSGFQLALESGLQLARIRQRADDGRQDVQKGFRSLCMRALILFRYKGRCISMTSSIDNFVAFGTFLSLSYHDQSLQAPMLWIE